MAPIFFLHLQKTGGTSINDAARTYFSPERALLLYGRNSQWTSPAAKELYLDSDISGQETLKALSDYIVENDIAYFASHIPATRLPCFDPARAFTILRHPVERVVSQYLFFRSKRRTQESLEAFIEHAENQNHQTEMLRGVDLKDLAVVGVLEDFKAFVDRLNAQFGLRLQMVHRKRGGPLKDIRAGFIGKAARRRIEMLNQEDAALYERALELSKAS